jgi:hypothetical protein
VQHTLLAPSPHSETHLASKAQTHALLALDAQRLLVLEVDTHEVERAEAKRARRSDKLGAGVEQFGALGRADEADVRAVCR